MKKIFYLVPLVLFFTSAVAQNLVPNPGFENYTSCPTTLNQVNYVNNWFQPTAGSPDYFNACGSNPFSDVPQNTFGFQYALEGSACMGIAVYDTFNIYGKEYIEVQLTSALQAATTYYVSFYVSLSDNAHEAVDQVGGFFSVDTLKSQADTSFNILPHISNPAFYYLTDKQNWVKISGSYLAAGNERFFTIGNFRDSANTHAVYVPGGSAQNGWQLSYYYIDYVCVSTDSLLANAPVSLKEFADLESRIYPVPCDDRFMTDIDTQATAEVFDLCGRKIKQQSLNAGTNYIVTKDWENGVYILSLYDKGSYSRQKIVVKH